MTTTSDRRRSTSRRSSGHVRSGGHTYREPGPTIEPGSHWLLTLLTASMMR
jgi:hypothetical protein